MKLCSGQSKREYSILSIPLEGDNLIIDIFNISKVTDDSYIMGRGKYFEHKHSHTYYELHIITEGENRYQIGDEEIAVKKGEFLLITPNLPHMFIGRRENTEKFGLCFLALTQERASREECEIVSLLPKGGYVISNATEAMIQFAALAANEKKTPAWGSVRNVRLLSGLILVEAVRMLDDRPAPAAGAQPYKNDERFALAEQFIKDNIQRCITCQIVANTIHISTRQLDRVFQKESGLTVAGYIERYRYNMAKRMLSTTQESIQKISFELGFKTQYNFSRFFKRMEGATPSGYRDSNRNN